MTHDSTSELPSPRRGTGEGTSPTVADPIALIRSREYHRLLVVAALIGVVVSLVSWGYLELVHALQQWLYVDLSRDLGYDTNPSWWPLPILTVAGFAIAFAVIRLPGHGGHEPSEGLRTSPPTQPTEVPGVLLAALATLGLGLVLGPEAPLGVVGIRVQNALQAAELIRRGHGTGLTVLTAGQVTVDADAPEIPVGIDGETVMLPTPVRCTIRPGALRVVLPRERPGVPAPEPPLDWPRLRQLASFRHLPDSQLVPTQGR